ncbi:transcriptional repressor [candidate division KSB3 bacterium]|uniref:Transcriptional repressor n=1 Tax=candidate division KSB3 bacterium TaxID=2044937 RepID=A0A9D5Q584_9BACT|nr:transcriptional repressor [candidate division KSB3 bacterium]MBD3324330.1 transcriptional repressor [candidate division KSB3 bacterium]
MQHNEQPTNEQKLDRFKEICKTNGIKLTPQRLIIYEQLISTENHPSTDMLYQEVKKTLPTISFDTVHRTLLTFSEIGVAEIVEGTGNPKRFDGNLSKHHHFQCVRCKKIMDLYDTQLDRIPIPTAVPEDFQIFRASIMLEGLCPDCQ